VNGFDDSMEDMDEDLAGAVMEATADGEADMEATEATEVGVDTEAVVTAAVTDDKPLL